MIRSSAGARSSGEIPVSDTTAQTTSSAARSPRRGPSHLRIRSTPRSSRSSAEAAANAAARKSPIGVAITNPAFLSASTTPGVAKACSARKPALANKAIATRNSRGSSRCRAASLARRPRTTFTTAIPRTSQKWDGWCCHSTSRSGTASSNNSPAIGIASRMLSVMIRPRIDGLPPPASMVVRGWVKRSNVVARRGPVPRSCSPQAPLVAPLIVHGL